MVDQKETMREGKGFGEKETFRTCTIEASTGALRILEGEGGGMEDKKGGGKPNKGRALGVGLG